MTIEKEKLGLIKNTAQMEQLPIWKTETPETAARLVFGALYQSNRYEWSQEEIGIKTKYSALWNNKPSETFRGRVYSLSDEELREGQKKEEEKTRLEFQNRIMIVLERCANACGRDLLPARNTVLPVNYPGQPFLRTDYKSVQNEVCSKCYSPTLVLFGPDTVDEAVRRNVLLEGLSEKLKVFLAQSGSIAVVERNNLMSTFSELERYYGDIDYNQWQSPSDQAMLIRNKQIYG
jgi:hypothetical protein